MLQTFRPFLDGNRGSRLPSKDIQKNAAWKRSLLTVLKMFDGLYVTNSQSLLHLLFLYVSDSQSGTVISIAKCPDLSYVYKRHYFFFTFMPFMFRVSYSFFLRVNHSYSTISSWQRYFSSNSSFNAIVVHH
jgi:hypothetical protein